MGDLARNARLLNVLPWLSGAVLVAGACAYVATRLLSGGGPPPSRPAKLDPVERRVAVEFVQTAVARKHLELAWQLAAPELKQGMTLTE